MNSLALDISTTCIGVSVLREDGILTHMSYIKLDKIKGVDDNDTFFLKAKHFQDYIRQFKASSITTICIEDPLQAGNNQFTANKLIRFNGVCSFILLEELGIQPTYLTVHDIRRTLCPEFLRTEKGKQIFFIPKNIDKKEYIWKIIDKTYPGQNWIVDKKGVLKKENFDMSDSVAINLAHRIQNIKKQNAQN